MITQEKRSFVIICPGFENAQMTLSQGQNIFKVQGNLFVKYPVLDSNHFQLKNMARTRIMYFS